MIISILPRRTSNSNWCFPTIVTFYRIYLSAFNANL